MPDAIMAMTASGFGVVGIVAANGTLAGIITDGDLRRHMSSDLFDRKVEDIMSRNPKVVAGDVIGTEALQIMQSLKIGVLFVVEDSKPVGIIHTLDLLRAGIA